MYLHLNGGGVMLTAPALNASLYAACKTVLRTADSRFFAIHISQPTAKRGAGLAAALVAASMPQRTFAQIKSQVDAAQKGLLAEIDEAKELAEQADCYNAFLRSCSAHILNGTDIQYERFAPHLAAAARTLRKAFVMGDPSGNAAATAAIIEQEADNAAAEIATAKAAIRRIRSATVVGILKRKADLYRSASIAMTMPGAAADAADLKAAEKAAKDSDTILTKYLSAYRATYRGAGRERPPTMKSIAAHRLHLKSNKSYGVL